MEQEPGIGAIDEVDEATSLLAKAQETSPDVVLLDWELPGLRDNQLLSELRAQDPQLRVIVLSGRPEARKQAIGSGADAFVSKSDPPDVLLAELHTVLAGKTKKGGTNVTIAQLEAQSLLDSRFYHLPRR